MTGKSDEEQILNAVRSQSTIFHKLWKNYFVNVGVNVGAKFSPQMERKELQDKLLESSQYINPKFHGGMGF